jgi:hypothetical protein
MYTLRVTLNTLPKSLNKKLAMHWAKRQKENKAWDMMIACAVRDKLPKKPLEKAVIHITRHNYRMLDYDSVVASCKPVVDALVTAGVIKDDSWGVLGPWHVNQVFRPKKLGPLIEVSVQARLDALN